MLLWLCSSMSSCFHIWTRIFLLPLSTGDIKTMEFDKPFISWLMVCIFHYNHFVIITLKLSCYVGVRLGLNTISEEIALVPFRFIKHIFYGNFLNIFSFRISVTEHCHEATNLVFPRGFSSNMIYNVWTVFGGIMM